MTRFVLLALALLGLALAPTQGHAQIRPIAKNNSLLPQKIETVTDDSGFVNFKFEAKRCPSCVGRKIAECRVCRDSALKTCPDCKGKKDKAPCYHCIGTGKTWDPLVWMPCPGCERLAGVACAMCRLKGTYPVQGGGKREQKCSSCKKAGHFACKVCKGKRRIKLDKALKFKPSLADAPLDKLKKAQAAFKAAREKVDDMRIEKVQASRILKDWTAATKGAKQFMPVLKSMNTTHKFILKGIEKGAVWVGHTERMSDEFDSLKRRTLWLFDYTLELMDVVIKRAEANAKAEEATAKKK